MARLGPFWRLFPVYLLAVAAPVSVSVAGIATGLVLVGGAVVGWRHRHRSVLPHRAVTLSLLALLLTYFLATLLAPPWAAQWHKFQEELWIKLLLLAVPILLSGRPEHAARILKVALGIGAVAAVFAVWQHFSGFDPIRDRSLMRPQWGHPPVVGFFSMHLSYAGQALIFLLLAAAGLVQGRLDRMKIGGALLVGLLGLALVWTFARSALLGAGAGLLVLVALTRGWKRIVGLSTVTAGLALGLMLPSVRVHLQRLLEMEYNLTRLNLWRSSLDGLAAEPLWGYGPGNYGEMMYLHMVEGSYETVCHAHNDLLMHGINAGWPGILSALALLASTCWILGRALRRESPWRWAFMGGLAVQVGITVAGLFQVYQTDDEVEILLYLVLGCLLALATPVLAGEPSADSRD